MAHDIMRLPIAPVLADNLVRLAKAYLEATLPTNPTVTLQSISRNAHGDPPFFDKLAAGECSVTLRKYDEIIEWFDEKAKWPTGYKKPDLIDPRHGPLRRKTKPKKARKNGKSTQGRTGSGSRKGTEAPDPAQPERDGE